MKTIFTRFNYLLAVTLLCLVSGNMWGQSTYELVTSADQLEVGANYLIVNTASKVALGKQAKNNRTQATIEIIDGNIVTEVATAETDDKPYALTLGGQNDAWTLYDAINNGYLNATNSTSKNYLHTVSDLDGFAYFKISFSDNNVVITCTGKTSRNTIQYNNNTSGGLVFSCYSSGQQSVQLFKKRTIESNVPSPTISLTSGAYWGKQTATLSQENNATILYTLDGTDPKEEGALTYSVPIEITETATLKAVAKSGEEYSNVVSAEYVINSLTANLPYEITFLSGLGDWITTTTNVEKVVWTSDAKYGAKIGDATATKVAAEAWLVSPEVTSEKNIIIAFESSTKGDDAALQLYYATDYNIENNTATWQELTNQAVWSTGNFAWAESGNVAVSSTEPIRFAFKYTSTADKSSIWEIRNLSIKEGAAQDKVETPTFTPAGGATEAEAVKVEYGTKVAVTSATDGAMVHYGDLSAATISVDITEASQKIEAYATKEGMTESERAEAWYSAYVATPTFSVAGGRVAKGTSVTITSTTAGAVVTYTIGDGAEQTYSTPIVLDETKEYTFKAKATVGGLSSEEATVTYTVYEPVVSTAVLVVKFVKDNVTTWYAMDQVEKDNAQGSGYNMNRRLVEVAEAERQVKATEDLVWTIEADGNQAYLKAQNGKYLNYTDDATKITLADEPYAWTVTKDEENNTYTYTNAANDRELAYNDAYSAFRCYAISNLDKNYTGDFYLMEAVENLPSSINSNTVNGTQVYSIDGALVINTDKAQNVQIYSVDGRMVRNIQLTEGENTISGLAQGVYLMNNQKVVIK